MKSFGHAEILEVFVTTAHFQAGVVYWILKCDKNFILLRVNTDWNRENMHEGSWKFRQKVF